MFQRVARHVSEDQEHIVVKGGRQTRQINIAIWPSGSNIYWHYHQNHLHAF